ncbi:MAG: hypothetical protein BZY81_04975 [SAR202 cluster bacterium Io17-Chloro-G4]|nr:MAG: hypothetical protein BZY81_04975 [SAR202 cluster bacterium Io17-Chloro-G4]
MCIGDGVNQSEDASLAARNALLTMIQLLMERGHGQGDVAARCQISQVVRRRLSNPSSGPLLIDVALAHDQRPPSPPPR